MRTEYVTTATAVRTRTVTIPRVTTYKATATATAKHTITTYKATVTARGTPPNRAPTASVSASPTTVVGGGAVTLDGTARDRDGDSLTYRWSSSGGGTFTSATALDTTWTAPAVTSTRTVTLTLTVRDSEGSSDTARVTITVIEASPPPAPATPTLGNPSARSLTASWTAVTVSGPAITGYDVRHIATSADETVDANWTVVDSATTGTATSYIIAGLSPTTSYDVQVRGVIGSVKGAWSSSATASTIANQPPTASASASPTRVEGGASVTLDGTAGDPDVGDTLTYEWTSDGGGSFADAAALDTTWTAPGATASDRTVTLTLTTTDEDGLAATATVDVTVAAASASSCVTDLGALTSVVTRNGSWASGCPSTNRVRAQARFYSFTLAQEKEVTIDLVSTDSPPENPYLYLLRGPTRSGRIVDRNNDIGGYPHYDSNSRIARTLSAGTYTVEATTYLGDKVGNFTVTITPAGDTAPAAPAAPSIGTGDGHDPSPVLERSGLGRRLGHNRLRPSVSDRQRLLGGGGRRAGHVPHPDQPGIRHQLRRAGASAERHRRRCMVGIGNGDDDRRSRQPGPHGIGIGQPHHGCGWRSGDAGRHGERPRCGRLSHLHMELKRRGNLRRRLGPGHDVDRPRRNDKRADRHPHPDRKGRGRTHRHGHRHRHRVGGTHAHPHTDASAHSRPAGPGGDQIRRRRGREDLLHGIPRGPEGLRRRQDHLCGGAEGCPGLAGGLTLNQGARA